MNRIGIAFLVSLACLVSSQASETHRVFGKWVEILHKKAKMQISAIDPSDEDHGMVKLSHGHKVAASVYQVYNSKVSTNTDGTPEYSFAVHLEDDGVKLDEVWVLDDDTLLLVMYNNTATGWVRRY